MKASFVLREMELNQIMKNRILWVEDDEGVQEQKIVDYVKKVPRSPIILVHFTDGEVMEMNEHKSYDFEVNSKLNWKKATRRQIKESKNPTL